MAAVEAGTGRMNATETRDSAQIRSGFTRFEEGDVLFAKITPSMENGKIAIASNLVGRRGLGSTEFHVLRPSDLVTPSYLMFYLLQESFRRAARASMRGVAGQLRVPPEFLAESTLPIPPLAEQRRIVAAIETQFTRLDAAVAALQRARTNLKRYRAAVLKAAVEGRLVPTEAEVARAEEREFESAERMLARLSLNRDGSQHGFSGILAPKEGNHSPSGWSWATAEQISSVQTGATPLRSKPEYYEGGHIPWVTSGALNSRYVDSSDEFITDRALRETNVKVFPTGTILIAMYGEGKTRGKVSELRIEATTNQACAALVFATWATPLRPYVRLFFEKSYDDLRRLAVGGNQPNLSLGIIKSTAITLPPLAEQERIVAEVDRRLSVLDELEAVVEHGLKRAERLRQAILKRAFEGKLVPQDPDDEPASVLLERIKAERNTMPSRTTKRSSRAFKRARAAADETISPRLF